MYNNGDQTLRMPALSREVARRNSLPSIRCQHQHAQQMLMDMLPHGTDVVIEAFKKAANIDLMKEVVTLKAALSVHKHFRDNRVLSLEMIR